MESTSPRQRLVLAKTEARSTCSGKASGSVSKLLVSVRDLGEARVAVSGGVDILDFKEPSRGALAACDPCVWKSAVSEFIDGAPADCTVRLSAALGESDTGTELSSLVPPEFSFAKVGPSGCSTAKKLMELWESVRLPQSVELVPVAYADQIAADTISVEGVLDIVIESGRHRLLIDTFNKDGRTLTDHLSIDRLRALASVASEHNVWIAFAGSLRLPEMRSLMSEGVRPDCWGVRGDVCDQRERTGRINLQKVTAWRKATGSAAI